MTYQIAINNGQFEPHNIGTADTREAAAEFMTRWIADRGFDLIDLEIDTVDDGVDAAFANRAKQIGLLMANRIA